MIDLVWDLVTAFVDTTTRPWRQAFWFFVHIYFTGWSIFLTLCIRLVTAPFHLLNAARREKELEAELQDLQIEYQELSLKRRELEMKLEVTLKDRKRIKDSLDRAVAEWEKSIDRLKLLKSRVQELENQNVRLREVDDERKRLLEKLKCEERKTVTVKAYDDSMLLEGRGVALASSIFSAILSLLVGLITWEAEDPCMPLVVALSTVVVMSLGNVVQFFTKLQSRYGFDAVALLSFNWFMLGTLAFPAFPFIAKFFAPVGMHALAWVAGWFGIKI